MQTPSTTLSSLLREKEGVLRTLWQSSMDGIASKIGSYHSDSGVFHEVRKLVLSLVTIVEKKGSAEQAVDSALDPIIASLKSLQEDKQLTSTEMVFFLFLMRDIVREVLKEASGHGHDVRLDAAEDQLEHVSALLNRLGLVFFENAMRLKDENQHQDVLAIEYALLYERTRQIAVTDRLTGLYNFGYFMERLREERLRAERYHRLLSLVIMDIDHFKKYNDTNGHPAGNDVLKKIAEVMKSEAREVDIVARYGGEEMVLILPETSRQKAAELADRIRLKISQTHFNRMEKQPGGRITISAGVATYPVDAATEEELIKRADSSLYEAKSQGRDRVVAFDPPFKITLVYRPYRPLDKVSLVGDFNNWDKDTDPMIRQPDGSFRFTISLNPGVYQYKFVLNDVEWIPDPNCPERVHDGLGGDNSILRVTA